MANFMQLEIRKLRKKLRQIEILERQDRNLNEDENEKVSRKEILRHELLHLLAQYPDDDKLPDEELNEEAAIVNTSPEHDEKVCTSTAIENTYPEHDDKVDISTEILNTSPEYDDKLDTSLTKGTSEISRQFDELAMKRSLRSTGLGRSRETAPCKKIKREQNEPIASTSDTSSSNEIQQKKQSALNKIKELRKSWENVSFLVHSLKGHNDLVTCAAIDNTLLVTGSRDTTIKVWNADTGIEEQSLRGHTSAVTCLVLLNESDSKILCAAYDNSRIIISGSQDCCVNVWSAKGIKINSMYTYNAVVSIGYISQAQLIVVGSESGKLELWEPLSGMNLQSFKAYEDPVTCLKVFENEVVTSGGDGVVKIWYLHLQQLRLVTNSEMIRSAQGRFVTQRYIRCLARTKNKVYYGDDGVNIKVWNIKRGIVLKLRNHLGEFGTTDTICDIDDLIISSSYNMDSGYSYLNVRALPFDNYLASFDDRSTHRIMALVATRKEPDLLRLVTAGQELKIWNLIRKRPVPKEEAESFIVVEPQLMPNFIQAADDSDSEIYSEDSESEDYDEESKFNEMSIYKPTFYKRWCCIL